jgi:hypothetical protein
MKDEGGIIRRIRDIGVEEGLPAEACLSVVDLSNTEAKVGG